MARSRTPSRGGKIAIAPSSWPIMFGCRPSMPVSSTPLLNLFAEKSSEACAFVVAGLHTGRNVEADFFRQISTSNENGDAARELSIAEIYVT